MRQIAILSAEDMERRGLPARVVDDSRKTVLFTSRFDDVAQLMPRGVGVPEDVETALMEMFKGDYDRVEVGGTVAVWYHPGLSWQPDGERRVLKVLRVDVGRDWKTRLLGDIAAIKARAELAEARAAKAEADLAAMRSMALPKVGDVITDAQEPAAPVPAAIDPLPMLAQWAMSGVGGVDSIRKHVESWGAGDGVNVGRERLQAALDVICDIQFSVEEKKWIASWVNRTLGRVGLILSRPGLDIAGSLAVIVGTGGSGSFRLQWSERLSTGRVRRFFTLGPRLGQIVVKESPKGPRHHEL